MTEHHEVAVVDGIEYAWFLRHGWLPTGRDIKGVSVSVCLTPGKTRELVLDFAFGVFGAEKRPPAVKLRPAVEKGIRAALLAGWEPESRGKTFRFDVREPEGESR